MRPILMLGIICLSAGLLQSCGSTSDEPPTPVTPDVDAYATSFTTRLPGTSPESLAVMISQAVYGGTREENSAGAIILTPPDPWVAFTAMHRITHMPINAPLYFLNADGSLPDVTMQEMARVQPDGVVQDGQVQVYVVGYIKDEALQKIRKVLKYKIRQFPTSDPILLAEALDRWQAAIKADHPDEIIVSAVDHPDGIAYGLGAMGWNAHMGKGFAWVYRDSIPDATRLILKRRFGDQGAYIYLTGPPDVISDQVAVELGQYGLVRRIKGRNPAAANATNAGYKDFGRDFGWWFGWESRAFGWGLAQAGHNFIFVNPENLPGIIAAALLGHMGKHGPILIVERDSVPPATRDYLELVQPYAAAAETWIANHGWIIGGYNDISRETQHELHRLLAVPGKRPDSLAFPPVTEGETYGQAQE